MGKNRFIKLGVAGVALVASGVSGLAQSFVEYNGTTGAVTFDPGVAIDPVINGVVAAVGAGVALFVVSFGVRYVYRMFKASK